MASLTPQEQSVLEAIRADPFIGQQEIALALGLSRSTVATHIASLVQKGVLLGRGYVIPERQRVVCIGGAVSDLKAHSLAELIPGTSNPVTVIRSFGGVARNVAETLGRLGTATSIASMVGADQNGEALIRHLREVGVDTSQIITLSGRQTAEYIAVLDSGRDLHIGLADMEIFNFFTPNVMTRLWPHLASASWVFVDCNLPADFLRDLFERSRAGRFKIAANGVSAIKVLRLPVNLAPVGVLFLNRCEADALLTERIGRTFETIEETLTALRGLGAEAAVLTLGKNGVAFMDADGVARTLPAVPARVVDVTGAGDALMAGTLHRLLAGDDLEAALRTATVLAAMTTEVMESVCPTLSEATLTAALVRLSPVA